MDRQYLTTTEAGAILGVTARTIVKWTKAGKLPVQRTLGGHRRYLRSEIEAIRDANTTPRNDQ